MTVSITIREYISLLQDKMSLLKGKQSIGTPIGDEIAELEKKVDIALILLLAQSVPNHSLLKAIDKMKMEFSERELFTS